MNVKTENYSQTVFELKTLGSNLTRENPVFLIKKLIQIFKKENPKLFQQDHKNTGRPRKYYTDELLGLILWGNYNQKHSCRKLAEWLKNNDESINYILNGKKPSKSQIHRFIKENKGLIKEFFTFTIHLGQKIGLISSENIFIDGTILKAYANPNKNIYPQELQYLERAINEYSKNKNIWKALHQHYHKNIKTPQITEIIQEIDQNLRIYPKKLFKQSLKGKEQKNRTLKQIQRIKENQINTKSSISIIDPDAKWMKNKKGKITLNYNYQQATDEKCGMIVGEYLTKSHPDINELETMAEILKKETIQKDKFTIIVDYGYYKTKQIERLTKDQISIIIPNKSSSIKNKPLKKQNPFTKPYFKFNKENDTYTCPNGETLVRKKNRMIRDKEYRIYMTYNCKECPYKEKCAKKYTYKRLLHLNSTILDEIQEKYESPEGQKLYKKRAIYAEGNFAILKESRNFRGIKRRGLKNANIELTINSIIHNIKKIDKYKQVTFI